MKRSLYKHLHHTLHSRNAHCMRIATAVMVVPDTEVPRWSPGPGWTEMETARMWAKPTAGGLLVTVMTHGREADGYREDDMVLATGVVTDFLGSLADKRHRIYGYAKPGTLHTELLTPDHPAQKYFGHYLEFVTHFEQTVEHAQDAVDFPLGYRTLSLRREIELRPDGQSWVCSLEVMLSPRPVCYWEDLAICTDVLMATARTYGKPRIALYRENPYPITDPLWHHGCAAVQHALTPVG